MREHHRIVALALTVAFVCAGNARAQDVKSNYVPGTDFSKYRTYKWVQIENGGHPNQIVNTEIMQAVDTNLAAKGFTKTTGDTADLFVGYQIAVDKEKQWNAYGGGLRWGGMGSATSSTIDVGTLVLDMYDPATKSLVWQGMASKTLDPSGSPEKNQQRLDKAMNKLLKDFPPTGKKK